MSSLFAQISCFMDELFQYYNLANHRLHSQWFSLSQGWLSYTLLCAFRKQSHILSLVVGFFLQGTLPSKPVYLPSFG